MRFRPSLISSLLLFLLAAVFINLGAWQSQRAVEKTHRVEAFLAAPERRGLPSDASAAEFVRTRLQGRLDTGRHVLVDNQVLNGRAGVHVYTPLVLDDGKAVLVNRGWLPLGADRDRLPLIPTGAEPLELSGRLGELPKVGRQLGESAAMSESDWPQLVTYPELQQVAAATGLDLYPLVLFLDPSQPQGFEGREWKPVFMPPEKHRAYAFQWYALALTAVAGWLVLGFRRGAQ